MKNKIYTEMTLKMIPRLLGLIDRNRYSPTYGCLDRNYWHYKTVDFPSSMYQMGSLPLALVYKYNFPGNVFYKKKRIKELSLAAIKFLGKISHKDGSTDEFYPFERALGATTISLCRATEAYLILDEKDKDMEDIFKKQANWILKNDEPGTMANHQAAAALALENVYEITKDKKYRTGAKERIWRIKELQSKEGWFYEYEGCDPGYLTVTIDFLADYWKKTKDDSVLELLKKAIEFSSYFIHPDGSYGGEYGSRNSYHFVPRGFEYVGNEIPLASWIVDRWLEGVKNDKHEFIDDDRYFIDEPAAYIQAYLNFSKRKKVSHKRGDFRKYFKEARIFVAKEGKYYVIISLAKGGVLKVFKNKELIYNDCGFIGNLDDGKIIVSQIIDDYKIYVDKKIIVEGKFNSIDKQIPSPSKFILFRTGLLTFGRSNKIGKFIKNNLTKKLILRKSREPINFRRTFEIDNGVKITDQIKLLGDEKIKSLAIGTDHTIIHVPGTRYYQESVLKEWIDLDKYLKKLNQDKRIKIRRVIK